MSVGNPFEQRQRARRIRYEREMREVLPRERPMPTSLGAGMLWPLFDAGHICAIRVSFLPECESTDEWEEFTTINPAAFMRVRRDDEVHDS